MIFEHGSPDGGTHADTRAIYDVLADRGYEVFASRGGRLTFDAFVGAVRTGEAWNFIAAPGRVA